MAKRHEGDVKDDDKISRQSVECGHVTQETAVAANVPAITDEIRREGPASLPSRRWLWSTRLWLAGLAACVGFVMLLELRILWRENLVAEQLHHIGYDVVYTEGWFRRLMPMPWRAPFPTFGDRITGLDVNLTYGDLMPLDDLIPQLQTLQSLTVIQLINSEGAEERVPSSIASIEHCLLTVNEIGRVKSVWLNNFRESQISEDFVQCLQKIEVERLLLLGCRTNDSDVACLKTLPKLKYVTFVVCKDSERATQQLKLDRPDIKVESADNLSGFGYP